MTDGKGNYLAGVNDRDFDAPPESPEVEVSIYLTEGELQVLRNYQSLNGVLVSGFAKEILEKVFDQILG